MVLLQPLKRPDHPVVAITRNRGALACAVGFQLAPGDPQPLDPTAAPRHYPTRPALLAALTRRSFNLVLQHARAAALSNAPALAALAQFFEQTIEARNEFVLPLHGGPTIHDDEIAALQSEIRNLLEQVLARGRRDRTIRPDATPNDIIITGAMLAQPLPTAADWDQLAHRQAKIVIAGLAVTEPPPTGSRHTRA